jgi:transcriptional regulator GlxA family with amidase domain
LRLKTPSIDSMLQTLVKAEGRAAGEAEIRECRERLLHAIVRNEFEFNARAEQLDCVKLATRQELLRRVLLASDFILTHFESPIQLQDIADAARVSMFHLVRPFGQIFGMPPHAYLMNKRLLVARRLLRAAQYDMHEIAQRSGFGNRWSLFRQMQKHQDVAGAGGAPRREASQHPSLGL